jgi:hypothetical protein
MSYGARAWRFNPKRFKVLCAQTTREGATPREKWNTKQRVKNLLQSSQNFSATTRTNCMSYDDVESTLSTLPDLKEDNTFTH